MVRNRPVRLIIDTNLWVSFIISGRLKKLDTFIYSNKVQLIFSQELIDELQRTASNPKLNKYFQGSVIADMLALLDPFIDLVETTSQVKICRDPNDDFLLALAKDSGADFLLTGDHDLLELTSFGTTQILTFTAFSQIFKTV